jgi:uncharacterized protein
MAARGFALVCGVLFAIGLALSGMTQPAKVLGFLDFGGNWDPSLAFVMVAAVGSYAVLFRRTRGLPRPRFAEIFQLPTKTQIDLPLVAGAALFGVGWGLSGYCPGPALTSVGSGRYSTAVFVLSMLLGMRLVRGARRRAERARAQSAAATQPEAP